MKNKKRSASSHRWLQEHFNDKYVQQTHKMGLRSRAWFKLDEMQRNETIFKSGMTIVDLGASPGSWSQYAITKIGKTGRVIACDLLPMDPIAGVEYFQGDFKDKSVIKTLLKHIGKNGAQVIMSDMTPNICGISEVDIPRSMYLVELVLEACRNMLATDGSFIVKIFHGDGFEKCLKKIHFLFKKIKIYKPNSSRACSREQYIIATGYKPII